MSYYFLMSETPHINRLLVACNPQSSQYHRIDDFIATIPSKWAPELIYTSPDVAGMQAILREYTGDQVIPADDRLKEGTAVIVFAGDGTYQKVALASAGLPVWCFPGDGGRSNNNNQSYYAGTSIAEVLEYGRDTKVYPLDVSVQTKGTDLVTYRTMDDVSLNATVIALRNLDRTKLLNNQRHPLIADAHDAWISLHTLANHPTFNAEINGREAIKLAALSWFAINRTAKHGLMHADPFSPAYERLETRPAGYFGMARMLGRLARGALGEELTEEPTVCTVSTDDKRPIPLELGGEFTMAGHDLEVPSGSTFTVSVSPDIVRTLQVA